MLGAAPFPRPGWPVCRCCLFPWTPLTSGRWSLFLLSSHWLIQAGFPFETSQSYFKSANLSSALRFECLKSPYVTQNLPYSQRIAYRPEHHLPIPDKLHALDDVLVAQQHTFIEVSPFFCLPNSCSWWTECPSPAHSCTRTCRTLRCLSLSRPIAAIDRKARSGLVQ